MLLSSSLYLWGWRPYRLQSLSCDPGSGFTFDDDGLIKREGSRVQLCIFISTLSFLLFHSVSLTVWARLPARSFSPDLLSTIKLSTHLVWISTTRVIKRADDDKSWMGHLYLLSTFIIYFHNEYYSSIDFYSIHCTLPTLRRRVQWV